ncbi:MAG TPA: cyanophycin synthetase, partial [Flavisolibacter sp.]|nr:cyanophycin synthetase [Flavisolibacter sp.]
GISAATFMEAISTFTGASKRLELLAENNGVTVYRDFAHAPSKVNATINAVRSQFPDRNLIAVLELHTYSSLNEAFMKEYAGIMDVANTAAVFYSRHALELKRMPPLQKEVINEGFANEYLQVFNNKEELENWLKTLDYKNSIVLLMSSGNYEGMDLTQFAQKITQTNI